MFSALSIVNNENFNDFVTNARNILMGFQWTDALDILILALLFYFVLRFFRSRKAGTLFIGISICVVLYALALFLNLTGVKYILSGIFQIGALAVVIIFQPEIRDLLESIGSGSIKRIRNISELTRKKQAQYKAIDNICKAVHVLSAEKTGALIVLGRTTGLDDVLHTGIEINADVSDYLIRNLFYDKAPLHDGAVLIEGNRIRAAACILPLP